VSRSADDKRARFLEAQQHSPDVPASTTSGATDRQSGAAEVGTYRHKPGVVGFHTRLPALGRQPGGRVWASHNGQVCSKALPPTSLVLRSAFPSEYTNYHMSVDYLIQTVADYFDITPEEIKGPDRSRRVSVPRKLACYLIRETLPLLSYQDISNQMGLRDHSTIVYYVSDINKKLETDARMFGYLNDLIERLEVDAFGGTAADVKDGTDEGIQNHV
jgi:hypothetical protein